MRSRVAPALFFVASLLVALTLGPAPAQACKGGDPPALLPNAAIESASAIVIAKIEHVELLGEQGRYSPPFRASGTVTRSLRGRLPPGEALSVRTSVAEGHAVCPIDVLKEGKTYLLFLTRSGGGYEIPRFDNLAAEESEVRFGSYLETIETKNRVEAKRSGCGGCALGSEPATAWWAAGVAVLVARARRRRARV